MCRLYRQTQWRCKKRFGCPGVNNDDEASPFPPPAQKIVFCELAIQRTGALEMLYGLGNNLPTPAEKSQPSPFASPCREIEVMDERLCLILPQNCRYHADKRNTELLGGWGRQMNATITHLPTGNGKVISHSMFHGQYIRYVAKAYALCLNEKAEVFGQGEIFRAARKLQTKLFEQMTTEEMPACFDCKICLDDFFPPNSTLDKAEKQPRDLWIWKAEIKKLLESRADMSVTDHDQHMEMAFLVGKYLFEVQDIIAQRPPEPAEASGVYEF